MAIREAVGFHVLETDEVYEVCSRSRQAPHSVRQAPAFEMALGCGQVSTYPGLPLTCCSGVQARWPSGPGWGADSGQIGKVTREKLSFPS